MTTHIEHTNYFHSNSITWIDSRIMFQSQGLPNVYNATHSSTYLIRLRCSSCLWNHWWWRTHPGKWAGLGCLLHCRAGSSSCRNRLRSHPRVQVLHFHLTHRPNCRCTTSFYFCCYLFDCLVIYTFQLKTLPLRSETLWQVEF